MMMKLKLISLLKYYFQVVANLKWFLLLVLYYIEQFDPWINLIFDHFVMYM